MKKYLNCLLILLLLLSICGCVQPTDPTDNPVDPIVEATDEELVSSVDAKLSVGEFTNSDYLYSQMTLKALDKNIPVYNCKINFSHSWDPTAPQRINNGVAIVEIEKNVCFTLTTTFKIVEKYLHIRPLEENVQYELVDQNNLKFLIKETGQYTIEFASDRTLHLFVNEYNQYDSYKSKSNLIYFGPGVHNKQNSSYISGDNYIHPSSNQTIFIDKGAVVEAGIIASNASNITVVGNGIITGAAFDRNANTNTRLIPMEFNYCNNIKFYGISNLDPAGWCYNLYFSTNIDMDNIKIISSRANGDGVSLQSCQNVECKNSFVRAWDDALVVKNYPRWDNRNIEGTTRNIKFYNCVIWTDLAQSMEVGYETVGAVMEDITFEKITVLHNYHKAVMSIHNANNANVKRVTFKDIVVEDASMGRGDGRNILIELTAEYSSTWSNGHKATALGSTSDVTIENVKVLKHSNPEISLRGSIDPRNGYSKEIHYVSNVTIKNVYLDNTKVDSNYNKLELVYTNNIQFI